jgi:hypothetical protein
MRTDFLSISILEVNIGTALHQKCPNSIDNQVNDKFDRTFKYDSVGRMVANTFGNGQSVSPYTQSITYDTSPLVGLADFPEWQCDRRNSNVPLQCSIKAQQDLSTFPQGDVTTVIYSRSNYARVDTRGGSSFMKMALRATAKRMADDPDVDLNNNTVTIKGSFDSEIPGFVGAEFGDDDIPLLQDLWSGKFKRPESDIKCADYLAKQFGVEGNIFAMIWDPVYGQINDKQKPKFQTGGYRGPSNTLNAQGKVVVNDPGTDSHSVEAAAHFYSGIQATASVNIFAPTGSVTDGKIYYFDEYSGKESINRIGAIFFSKLGNLTNVVLQIQHTKDIGKNAFDSATGRRIIGATGGIGGTGEVGVENTIQVHMELFAVGNNTGAKSLKEKYLHHLPNQNLRRKDWVKWSSLCP